MAITKAKKTPTAKARSGATPSKKSPKKSPKKAVAKRTPAKETVAKKTPKKTPMKSPKKSPTKKVSTKKTPKDKAKKGRQPTATMKPRMNAYMKFVQANRKKLVAANPNMAVTAVGKKLGEMWRKLSDDEKAKYK